MKPGMSCAAFESGLADALASSDGGDPRVVAALRDHAAGCPRCAPSAELIDLAALPAEERDPVDDPPPRYWSGFEARLAVRLAAPERGTRRAARFGVAVAAAIVLVVVLILARRPAPPPPVVSKEDVPAATAPAPDPAAEDVDTTDDWDDPFAALGPIDAFTVDDATGIFPSVDDLSPADEERFLDWLSEEEARVGGGRG
ncbi:MAG TPA: hypothetical protein VFB67_02665 [Candidatus Polarisedimenticolaceae bacterium]|nr:hypothetical protein [Candidatus Polarisedimenticolaceae bacterium]